MWGHRFGACAGARTRISLSGCVKTAAEPSPNLMIQADAANRDELSARPTNRLRHGRRVSLLSIGLIGDPEWIRTTGLQIRNLMLYPTELRGLARLF